MHRPTRLALALALVASACASAERPTITVGSFNFTESRILAEVYASALEARDYPVQRRPNLGAREVVLPALRSGQIDLLPEYTGSALRVGFGGDPTSDPSETAQLLRAAAEAEDIVALDAAPAQDQNVFVVRRQLAQQHDLRTVSDLARIEEPLVVGGPPECDQRLTCFQGLRQVYGLDASFRPLDVGGARTVDALESGEVDVAVLFSTQPVTERDDLVVLEDDRGVVGAENIVPLVHASVLDAYGEDLVTYLNTVTAAITTDALRALNREVDEGGVSPPDAAASFLEEQGLLEAVSAPPARG